jgi:hypothetical protein
VAEYQKALQSQFDQHVKAVHSHQAAE